MLLAFDTSSAACTVALFDGEGRCVASADEVIGRGHAERLMPLIAEVMADQAATQILVGVGPGSFTGIRVAIAAAHGLAIGWNAHLAGMSSLALIAAGAATDEQVAAAVLGGHGEIFVQQFNGETLARTTEVINAQPADAGQATNAPLVLGSGAGALVSARGFGSSREAWPSAANALKLPTELRTLDPRPVYARAPDARLPAAA